MRFLDGRPVVENESDENIVLFLLYLNMIRHRTGEIWYNKDLSIKLKKIDSHYIRIIIKTLLISTK